MKKEQNKKILIIFPHNFFELKSGIHKMFYHLAKYFKSRNYIVDLYSLKNYESIWEGNYPFDSKIISNLYLFDYAKGNQNFRISFKEKMMNLFFKIFKFERKLEKLPDYAFPEMKEELKKIVNYNQYTHIIVGYAYWANLIKDSYFNNIVKIISINDFLTYQIKEYSPIEVNIDKLVKDEINRINLFDIAISISNDEYLFFKEKAKKPKHYLIPIFFDDPLKNVKKIKSFDKRRFDITFLGFKNIHNINGINWFLNEVWPKIRKKYKLRIVGKVVEDIVKLKDKNIRYDNYIKNLNDVYLNTKITISPLFSGTGLKVKIIESLAYGIPVVSTSISLLGFPKKENNGCLIADNAKDFVKQIDKLIKNHYYYKKISKLGRDLFLNYFEKELNYKKLDEIFNFS